MRLHHTYTQIAESWTLWREYVDADATMTEEEFGTLTIEQKTDLLVDAFGPEAEPDDEDDDDDSNTKRDMLVTEHLVKHGIASIEDAPDELIDSAHAEADAILGAGKNN